MKKQKLPNLAAFFSCRQSEHRLVCKLACKDKHYASASTTKGSKNPEFVACEAGVCTKTNGG